LDLKGSKKDGWGTNWETLTQVNGGKGEGRGKWCTVLIEGGFSKVGDLGDVGVH